MDAFDYKFFWGRSICYELLRVVEIKMWLAEDVAMKAEAVALKAEAVAVKAEAVAVKAEAVAIKAEGTFWQKNALFYGKMTKFEIITLVVLILIM